LRHDALAKRNTELKLKFNHKIDKGTTKSKTKIATLQNCRSGKKLKKKTNQFERNIYISDSEASSSDSSQRDSQLEEGFSKADMTGERVVSGETRAATDRV
jgi:hypothetical protein